MLLVVALVMNVVVAIINYNSIIIYFYFKLILPLHSPDRCRPILVQLYPNQVK